MFLSYRTQLAYLKCCDEENPLVREQTHFVVSHGGNCDLPVEGGIEELNVLADRIDLELYNMLTLCPNAELIISGIPPRYGEGREAINDQIMHINERLENFAENEDRAYYANNYAKLTEDGKAQPGFYKLSDPTGIHLNDGGKEEIAKSIMSQINLAFMCLRQKRGWNWVFDKY